MEFLHCRQFQAQSTQPYSTCTTQRPCLLHIATLSCSFRRREKRLLDESLRKVKTLGQADEDVDDLAKWVTKSRTTAEEEKELARLQAAAAALKAEEVCTALVLVEMAHTCIWFAMVYNVLWCLRTIVGTAVHTTYEQ